jgi:hypothetical protein
MRKIVRFILLAFPIALFLPAEAAAQWYAGIDAGMLFDTFRAEYTFRVGTPDRYLNHASGPEAGVLLGYDFTFNRTLTLGIEVRSATTSARWELDTIDVFEGTAKGGPSHLRYEIPWNVRATAVFKVRILPDIAVTGELGMGRGLIRENKTSAVSTTYDYQDWVPCVAAGAGLECRLSRKLDLIARFSAVGYRTFTYTSHFPDGELWETVSDQPSGLSGRLGLLFRIGER